MKITKSIFFIVSTLISQCLLGQYKQERLFPDLSGDALLQKVVEEYKADIQFFTYGMTRDTMFKNVYAVNDSLSCVYSGHTLYMDPNNDPTTTVFLNGDDDGINTEHTYPQSKGAKFGNARSDMHHLYPARAMVNEERSNFPFGEIPDDEATKWFYKDQTLLTKPESDLDNYSEWKWQVFEPRESFKGNIARAVMYFYTMYKGQADAEDPDFFWNMIPTLCEWHYLDPVDSTEYVRSNLIAKWQVYPNPFILDCSLASRSYCDVIDDACELAVPVVDLIEAEPLYSVFYSSDLEGISITPNLDGLIEVFDITGRKVISSPVIAENENIISARSLESGNYIVKFISNSHSSSKIISVSKL